MSAAETISHLHHLWPFGAGAWLLRVLKPTRIHQAIRNLCITTERATMQTAMTSTFVGAPLAARPQKASAPRSRAQVVRAGKYDEELQQTAVSALSSDWVPTPAPGHGLQPPSVLLQ